MNGAACRALAAVLSAASAEDGGAYLDRCTELERKRIHDAMQSFEATFNRRRWRSVVDRTLLDTLMAQVQIDSEERVVQETGDHDFGLAQNVPLLGDEVALPEKTKRAINTILSTQSA